MIIGLVGLIISLLAIFAGPKDDPLIVNIDKYAKKVVVDKDTYNAIKGESKEIATLGKAYVKQTKEFSKQLSAITEDQNSTPAHFEALMAEMTAYEQTVNDDYYTRRLNILGMISDEEWTGVLDRASKDIAKDLKAREKIRDKYAQQLEKTQLKIVDAIEGGEKKHKARGYLKDYVDTVDLLKEDLILVYHNNSDLLMNRNATMDQMLELSEEFGKDWAELYSAYINLHQNLSKLCDENDWKKVSNQMDKL